MNDLRRLALLLALPLVLLGGLYATVALRSPAPGSAPLVRTADRKLVWAGDSVTVRLHVNGDRFVAAAAPAPRGRPNVSVLLIDHSSSMGAGQGSALESARSAAGYFARVVAGERQPVGVVEFDDAQRVVAEPGPDGAALERSILAIAPGGGTDIAAAIRGGTGVLSRTLASGTHRDAQGVLILLSDGGSEPSSATRAADSARALGYRIVTIGVGSQIDEPLLRALASTEADFHHTVDAAALGDVYLGIAGEFAQLVGRGGTLAERYNYGGLRLRRPISGLQTQVDEEHGSFQTQLPVVFAQRLELPYQVEAAKVGLLRIGLGPAELRFTREGGGGPVRLASSAAPPLLVISPLLLLVLSLPALLYLATLVARWLAKGGRGDGAGVEALLPPRERVPERLRLRPIEEPLPRTPEPTLFVGVGDAGARVLEGIAGRLREDLYLRGRDDAPLRLLQVGVGGAAASADEPRFPLRRARVVPSLVPAAERLRDGPAPPHLGWVPRPQLREAGNAELDLTRDRGLRWATRLALFTTLESRDPAFFGPWDEALAWLAAQGSARVVLVGSLESGAGGVLHDLAYLLRAAAPAELRSRLHLVALGLADVPVEHGAAVPNERAFLAELGRHLAVTPVPLAMVYDPAPDERHRYLAGEAREPVYDAFFLLQSPTDQAAEVDRAFLSQLSALGHTLTERSLAARVVNLLKDARAREQRHQAEALEGAVHTARLAMVRSPAREMADRLGWRFVMEVVARLAGVETTPDGRAFRLQEVSPEAVDEALAEWGREGGGLGTPELAPYRAFCAAGAPQAAGVAVRNAAAPGGTAPEALRDALHRQAPAWVEGFLNGPADAAVDRLAAFRGRRVALLERVLARLVACGGEVMARGAEGPGTQALVAEMHRFHTDLLAQVRAWLELLVDGGCCSPDAAGSPPAGSPPAAGVYRTASDRRRRLCEQVAREAALPWQWVLADGAGGAEFTEDGLYRAHLRDFLDRHGGMLAQFLWQFRGGDGGQAPRLALRLVTDDDGVLPGTAAGAERLLARLRAVAASLTSPVERTGLLDRLRGPDGRIDPAPLLSFITRQGAEAGLGYDRRHAGPARRRVLVMLPRSADAALDPLLDEVGRALDAEVERADHNDPHAVRILVVDTVIPVGAVRTRRLRPSAAPPGTTPYVLPPEQEADRLRRAIEERLGVAPAPELHPLTRLLAAAPMPAEEWVALVAEDALRGGEDGIVLDDGVHVEAFAGGPPAASLTAALVDVAYARRGANAARRVVGRWNARPRAERESRLAAAATRLRDETDAAPEGVERRLRDELLLLVRLELALLRARAPEVAR